MTPQQQEQAETKRREHREAALAAFKADLARRPMPDQVMPSPIDADQDNPPCPT